ncbi:metal-dependent hydrolase [Lysinibacillus sp. 1P01SD]|uniref:metal-dependent hydrolase n=1 Tax=Lysinibacillus sp. 1P01SD TaxID=3132285 RepID=UPI0039A2DF1C
MNWDTHMLSGAIAGYLVTNTWEGAFIGGIAGIIPDIDEPNSKFGKLMLPISYPLSKVVAHRTMTHSLPFAIILGILGATLFQNVTVGYAIFVGIFAHILGDMLTGKVQLLYPIKKMYGIRINLKFFYIIDRITICLLFSVICIHLLFKIG